MLHRLQYDDGSLFAHLASVGQDERDERTDSETLRDLDGLCDSLNKRSADAATHISEPADTPLPEPNIYEAAILAREEQGKKVNASSPEGVAKLSGGQYAKILLTRSFLKDVDLVILDEFSAALDPTSESEIFQKFMKRRELQTIIAVTHRFHLAVHSDRILFMKDGRVVENGSHSELCAQDGEYKRM